MKIKVSKHNSNITTEVLREEVELSNTRTAYVMHIHNTRTSLFFMVAILLCAVRDAQGKASESP